MRADEKLEREVASIGDLSRVELIAAWIKAFGCPPPAGVRRELLVRATAWHLQARRLGGLSAATNKLLRSAIRDIEVKLARRVPASPCSVAQTNGAIASKTNAGGTEQRVGESDRLQAVPKPRKVLSPGARLMRDWNGSTYVVDVLEEGFAFEGKIHRSLSVIARSITGTHWSGPRFFGL